MLVGLALGGCACREARLDAPTADRMAMARAAAKSIEEDDGRVPFDAAVALAADLRYAEAERQFALAAERFVRAGRRDELAEAVFWQGYCQEMRGRHDEAREKYFRVLTEHVESPAAQQAEERLEKMKKQE